MSLQICIKTNKSLQYLATEIREIFSLPPFKLDMGAQEPYCQFEMLGMLVFIYQTAEEDRDPRAQRAAHRGVSNIRQVAEAGWGRQRRRR